MDYILVYIFCTCFNSCWHFIKRGVTGLQNVIWKFSSNNKIMRLFWRIGNNTESKYRQGCAGVYEISCTLCFVPFTLFREPSQSWKGKLLFDLEHSCWMWSTGQESSLWKECRWWWMQRCQGLLFHGFAAGRCCCIYATQVWSISSSKHKVLPFLPPTPLSPSRTLEGLFELTLRPSRDLASYRALLPELLTPLDVQS